MRALRSFSEVVWIGGAVVALALGASAALPAALAAVTQNTTLTMPGNSLGMVGHWTFDGKDMLRNVADTSGQGNTGYMVAAATSTQVTPGPLGQALKFNGTTQYVDIPSVGAWPSHFTISGWIYLTANGSYPDLFGDVVGGGQQSTSLRFLSNSRRPEFVMNYPAAGWGSVTSADAVTLNTWHHLVGAYDGTNIYLFVDGVLVGSAASTNTSSTHWYIANIFPGTLDDVRIYNRALSAAEVKQLYNQGTGSHLNASNRSGLVGWWTFDSPTIKGSSVTDNSGQGNTGTMVAGPSVVMGKINQALSFNGTTQYVHTLLDPNAPAGAVTWWAYPTTAYDSGTVRGCWGNLDFSCQIYGDNNWYVGWGNGSGRVVIAASAANAPQNTWSHYVYKWSASGGVFYMNGAVIGTSAAPVVGIASPFDIGIYNGLTTLFVGKIDDVRIYNRALSQAEITQLYVQAAGSHQNVTLTPPNLATGLVGHWTFDGKDMIKNVADTSGQNNTGYMVAAATSSQVTPGIHGQALKFNGTSQYVTIANESNFDFERTQAFSVCSWFNTESITTPTVQTIVTKMVDSGGFAGWQLQLFDGSTVPDRVSFELENLYSSNRIGVSAPAISINKWYYVCATYTGSSAASGVKIYYNGVSQSLTTYADTLSGSILNDTPVTIGKRITSWPFNGTLDDVRIYNRALSAAEVLQLYNLGR